jgi:hypothetical protein
MESKSRSATLVLINMPDDITVPEVITALNVSTRRLLANVYRKRRHTQSDSTVVPAQVFLNFHTIMAAEQVFKDHNSVLIRGVPVQLQWTRYPFEPVLLLGFFEDFPLDDILALLQPYAHVKQVFKTSAHPNLVVVHTGSGKQAQAAQRALHGSIFREKPLFVGNERPQFQSLKGMYYVSIKHIQPDVPDAWYKAPSIVAQLDPAFTCSISMNDAYKALALEPDPVERFKAIAALRKFGAAQLREWNSRIQMLERMSQ